MIVVGARCAGAAAAMLLARAGYRVALLERSRFPKDTLSTLYIHQPGVAMLDRWDVLPEVIKTGCPPLDRVHYTLGDITLEGSSWPADGQHAAYAPRRHLLDSLLAQAAVRAGADFRDNCTVTDLVFDGDRVAGVRTGSGSGSGAATERARLVIGADGMRSTVADRVRAPKVTEDPRATCAYYSYWTGLPPRFRLYESPGGWVGTVPTNDGLTLVAGYFPQRDFAAVRGAGHAALLTLVGRTAPEVRAQMARGQQAERLHGTGDQQNFFRQASGPGWALIGDAGHHKDSITARGITDAFLQAQLLADCIGDRLHDPAALDRALEVFADRRTDLLMPHYRATLKTARLDPPGHQRQMLRAVATSTELTDRYFSVLSGVCPLDEFVTPELMDLLEEPDAMAGEEDSPR
ncbi:NAD(P)/FAD-dependent oxidoreductase [Streptomyces sp. YIM 98790]|uniref:NAD(P)/FAD-dependent oxidoreductase n=1 Tax=Streptomyces sp. YIM 98790 TaxID=2689077 RepID=UPI0028BDBA93|nr:NAD(P)/FAD-dependent oxidoreductase [Streptomyces sp. YIM 98790]